MYPRLDHVPAAFTVLNLFVEDIDEAVDDLLANGVTLERYEGIDIDERGIFHGRGHSLAWFTDPAGNVVAIGQRE